MFFRFIGEDDSDPDTISLFGYEFIKNGDPVNVEGDHALTKLNGNTHFEKVPPAGKPFVVPMIADMKMGELRAVGRDRGLTFPVGTTKTAILEALNVGD